ncbi:MAG: zinc-finger-containing protein [Acidiphilium sp.]|nr:zinc-finger-containing protein [Acidiphilium sp.]
MRAHTKEREVFCTCGRLTRLLHSSQAIYGKDFGPVWYCDPCDAWVGVHRNSPTFAPLGKPADKRTRLSRRAAHRAFDPLWIATVGRSGTSRAKARKRGYAWLAARIGIPVKKCHIGYFDEPRCRRVVVLCQGLDLRAGMGNEAES